jgi:hypothetical protein
MTRWILRALAVGWVAAAIVLPAGEAQAEPQLTYRQQQWVDKNGHVICAALAKNPTEAGLNGITGSLTLYYEFNGRDASNYIIGSVAQQCPQYSYLIPVLR